MVMYKAMSDLLWTLWAVIQVVNENPVEDFRAYGVGRFERCKALMASPVFAGHLVAACDG
jgi:thiamine kinase-like enzyme